MPKLHSSPQALLHCRDPLVLFIGETGQYGAFQRKVLGLVSANNTQDLSRTSQGPSSVQMEVIWLRPCADFTNNDVILVHTHSHVTSFRVPSLSSGLCQEAETQQGT